MLRKTLCLFEDKHINGDVTKPVLNVCCRKLNKNKREEELLKILLANLDYLGFEVLRSHGRELSHYLNQAVSGNPLMNFLTNIQKVSLQNVKINLLVSLFLGKYQKMKQSVTSLLIKWNIKQKIFSKMVIK